MIGCPKFERHAMTTLIVETSFGEREGRGGTVESDDDNGDQFNTPRWGGGADPLTQTALRTLRPDQSPHIPAKPQRSSYNTSSLLPLYRAPPMLGDAISFPRPMRFVWGESGGEGALRG